MTRTMSLSISSVSPWCSLFPPWWPADASCVLYDNPFEDVGGVLTGVDGVLDPFEDVLPADHDHRVDSVSEERGERLTQQSVSLVLESVHLDEVMVEVAKTAQALKGLRDVAAAVLEHARKLL